MNRLLGKDSVWWLFFACAGSAALGCSLTEHSFLYSFVASPGAFEALYYVTLGAGVLLGAVAACFDEALGTREFLAQRPLATRAIVRSRIHGCATVMAVWFVLVPLVGTVAFWVSDRLFEFGWFRQVPAHWATMTTAVPATAIGFAAGSLPFAWWARLLNAGVAVVVVCTMAWWIAADAQRNHDCTWFAGANVVAGVLLFAVGARASCWTRDPDLPLPRGLRVGIVAPLLVLAALLFSAFNREALGDAIWKLHRAYPEPVVHAGRVALQARDSVDGVVHLVDAEHRPLDITLGRRDTTEMRHPVPLGGPQSVRVEAPRFGRWAHTQGGITLGGDGVAFVVERSRFRRVGKGPEQAPFAPGSRVGGLGPRGESQTVIAEPLGSDLWRYDASEGHFVATALPDGDRVVEFEWDDAATDEQREAVVEGARGVYALRGGQLIRIGEPRSARTTESSNDKLPEVRVQDYDLLSWRAEFAGDGTLAAWSHEFTPRTLAERWHASVAWLLSSVRPPVLQAIAAAQPVRDRWPVLLDPLVANWRRPWLLLTTLGLAVGCAWSVRNRLQRLGADAPARRFWVAATLLLGPFAALVSWWAERPRAWAKHPLPLPRVPRISSHPVGQQVLP